MTITTVRNDHGIVEVIVDAPPVNALTVAGWFDLADQVTAAGADPTTPPPAIFDVPAVDNSTHTIPRKQSATNNISYPSDPNEISELGVSPDKYQVRNLADDAEFAMRVEGEGVEIPPGNWDVEVGEVAPHVKKEPS